MLILLLKNLGFAWGAVVSVDPPTAMPLRVELATAVTNNGLIMEKTANAVDPVKSKNSVTF